MTALLHSPLLRSLLLLVSLTPLHASAQEVIDPETSNGESAKQFGPDTVYYSVLNTTFLSPKVASSYGIKRGANNFLLNIAVRHQQQVDGQTSDQPITANITGTTSDLIYKTPLTFKEVIEQNAIYYLAEFDVSNKERRSFQLQIQTATRALPYELKFNRMLYPAED